MPRAAPLPLPTVLGALYAALALADEALPGALPLGKVVGAALVGQALLGDRVRLDLGGRLVAPLAGLAFGAALGLGVARPFAEWLRLQARLVHLQVLVERHTRRTQEHSEATARKLEGLVETGLSGEWRTSGADIPAVP